MIRIGCHLSSSKGYLAMGKEAVRIGADTFQFFTRNPRGGAVKPLDEADIAAYLEFVRTHGLTAPLAHAPYTLNPCGKEERVREFARMAMLEDLDRLSGIPDAMYNFHPGSHVGQGVQEGVRLICRLLEEALSKDTGVTILLETMAGKGSEVGSTFEELKMIIDGVGAPEKIGVCLDTCHVYDAGYDIASDLDGVLERFDRAIGLSSLKAIHLNDSKNPFASHKDRHEKIGEGTLGMDTFRAILTHPVLRGLPFYLETPQEDNDGYAREIRMLRDLTQKE
ncbi:MAG: deoxyribonuclease IV [Clostridia bacterium]|nr:deoxyribonuclease IV [Clostridia bacterium]